MKYFIVAGEASGDLHGANLMKSLKMVDPSAEFYFFGGDLMLAQGGVLLKHYHDMAFMGAIDVLMNLGKIRKNFQLCKEQLFTQKPDTLILIDYPGFNLKVAEFAHNHKIRVFYYILPKLWAWKAWRVKKLKSYVDALFSIFPFESAFFRQYGVKIHYFGNPLIDSLSDAKSRFRGKEVFLTENHLNDKPVVALLPGSRSQEIRMMLPVMTRMAREFPDFQFVISGTPAINPFLYQEFTSDPSVPVVMEQTYELLHYSYAALVTSGTATLETALFGVPQVVLYKMAGGKIGWRLFRFIFLKVKYVSLPNLIVGEEVVREFIMEDMKYENVRPEVQKILSDNDYRSGIIEKYKMLSSGLGDGGASMRVATQMVNMLKGG
jgi:lipid-A-disaccharide synthase